MGWQSHDVLCSERPVLPKYDEHAQAGENLHIVRQLGAIEELRLVCLWHYRRPHTWPSFTMVPGGLLMHDNKGCGTGGTGGTMETVSGAVLMLSR